MLSRIFDPGVNAKDSIALEEHPVFRILHNDLTAVIEALGAHADTLNGYLAEQAAMLNSYITEGGTSLPGSLTYSFPAQTNDVELVNTVLSYIPATATSAFITLDDWKIPLPTGEINSTGLQLPVRHSQRLLTMTGPVGATESAFVMVTARPAPANVPGILH